MSAGESGSDTWPRYVPLPADNLDVSGAPEEDDVDHRGEAPSWLPVTGAVTGADPPDPDTSDDEQRRGAAAYTVGSNDGDAPGFADAPGGGASYENGHAAGISPDFDDASAPGFSSGQGEFNGGQGESSVYGDAPGFSTGQGEPSSFGDAPAFGGAADGGYSPEQGAGAFGYGGADDLGQGYSDGQPQGSGEAQGYPVTGEFRGVYESGYGSAPDQGYSATPDTGFGGAAGYGGAGDPGFGSADPGFAPAQGVGFGSPDGGFGAAPAGDFGPAQGIYGDRVYQQAGQGNGAAPVGQSTGYPPPGYQPPVAPPKPPISASVSLRQAKRRGRSAGKRNDQGRQAMLTVNRIEPWSVMKFSFVISLVAFIVFFVAIAVLYMALSGLGVFTALQHSVENITSSQGSSGFNLMTYLSASRVLGYTGLLGAINVVLITALCTVGSVLYNLSANLAGGVEVTLKESE